MSVALIVQARLGSTRLPGKVLKEVLGKPLLFYLIERLKQVKQKHVIIVATTTNSIDDPIISFCQEQQILTYRGSEHDVLKRYTEAAMMAHREIPIHCIARITSDCPLIDPAVIDMAIQTFSEFIPHYDYVTNTLIRTYPQGMDVEVFSLKGLLDIDKRASDPYEREHVTPYFYRHPERYRLKNFKYVRDESKYRWTVDTLEDFEHISCILKKIYPKYPQFTLEQLLKLESDSIH